MLDIQKMIRSAEECLGWPYVRPGSNDANGIDCSGLFVKIYRDQGASIYHGSNTIYRKYCTEDKGPIKSANQLKPGMAVFKWNENTPEKFNDGLGDFQHIGLVVSASPELKIIHASSAAGYVTTDTKLGKWKYYGRLKDVDYEGGADPSGEDEDQSWEQTEPVVYASVWAENGKPVKLRYKPTTRNGLYDELPVGTIVEVVRISGDWTQCNYGNRQGWWIMTKFLSVDEKIPDEEPISGGPCTVIIPGLTEAEAKKIQEQYPKAEITFG